MRTQIPLNLSAHRDALAACDVTSFKASSAASARLSRAGSFTLRSPPSARHDLGVAARCQSTRSYFSPRFLRTLLVRQFMKFHSSIAPGALDCFPRVMGRARVRAWALANKGRLCFCASQARCATWRWERLTLRFRATLSSGDVTSDRLSQSRDSSGSALFLASATRFPRLSFAQGWAPRT